jgi:hypothetical protein
MQKLFCVKAGVMLCRRSAVLFCHHAVACNLTIDRFHPVLLKQPIPCLAPAHFGYFKVGRSAAARHNRKPEVHGPCPQIGAVGPNRDHDPANFFAIEQDTPIIIRWRAFRDYGTAESEFSGMQHCFLSFRKPASTSSFARWCAAGGLFYLLPTD